MFTADHDKCIQSTPSLTGSLISLIVNSTQVISYNVHDMCHDTQVLREFVGAYGPLAIMLEDLHHFDTTSWSFLTTVVEHLSQEVLIVTTMRPNDGVLAAAGQHEEGEAVVCASCMTGLCHSLGMMLCAMRCHSPCTALCSNICVPLICDVPYYAVPLSHLCKQQLNIHMPLVSGRY